MTTSDRVAPAAERITLPNALAHYYDELCRAAANVRRGRMSAEGGFAPAFAPPPLTPAFERYFAAAELGLAHLGEHRGVRLMLLDLMRNPGTRTTKTIASLLMVARAVEHIRRTGESIMMITPSSANKATALRDAVWRAIDQGLVAAHQLRIVVVVPDAARQKLWSSPLATDPELARRNPVLVYPGADRSAVKTLAKAVVDEHSETIRALTGLRVWYSLDIDNYRMADAARAFFENEFAPRDPSRTRVHAHAVSSAYGLLGHHLGHVVAMGPDAPAPRYFLVQHLDTPDMVLSLYFGSTSRRRMPRYTYDGATGLYTQSKSPHFPASTYDPAEVLDPTFYTHQPPTSEAMNRLIHRSGGGGIVVSLHECLARYPRVRSLLAPAGIALPADPRRLREWSLVMAVTGVLNAIDRGLITEDEVMVHGSGCYRADDFEPVPEHRLQVVTDTCQVRKAVFYAALVDSCR